MPDNLVSIIMPVYNAAPFLADCLKSIQQQSFSNWELIAIDDFSTDASFKVLEEASSFDRRIRVIKNTKKGIIPALSLSLKNANGHFITRMDADDIMPADRLLKMVEALKAASPKTVITGLVDYFSSTEVSQGYKTYQDWLNKNIQAENPWVSVYRECIIASPCWMLQTQELRDIGGFDSLEYPEDYDLVFRLFKNQFQIKALPEVLLKWREHPARTSRNSEDYAQESFFKLKVKRFLEFEKPFENLVLWGTGVKARLTAKLLLENSTPFTWMDLHPEKYTDGIFDQIILPFREIEEMEKVKLILAIYPAKKEKLKMENYLKSLSLKEVEAYWYF